MPKTLEQQLEDVQTAIEAVLLRGQSFELNGRKLRRADLKDLRDEERRLTAAVARQSTGGIRVRRAIPID